MDVGRVAIVGFGRFGRALADLVLDVGGTVAGYDPEAEVPDGMRAASVADAVRGAGVVVPAVPVDALADALRAVRPHLDAAHLVVEVSSVKRGPVAALHTVLGDDVAWVATHPLFGPSSIALGERPLSVVVCPRAARPDLAERGAAFWRALGCRVLEQDADDHDRVMARTHALAFFVAKGLLDLGVGNGLPFAPPSFQAMARTIESVRSDASHLFRTIQIENPFAEDARARLLDALEAVHRDLVDASLRDAAPGGPDTAAPPAIPDLGARAPELRETRDLIDDLDREIVRLLARRGQLSRRAGRVKARAGRPIRDAGRESALLAERRRWAGEEDLDAAAVAAIFEKILGLSRDVQRRDPERDGAGRAENPEP